MYGEVSITLSKATYDCAYLTSVGEGYDGANELVQAYKDKEADFHQEVADLVGIERTQAKTIGLGLMYGMGKNKLANSLG